MTKIPISSGSGSPVMLVDKNNNIVGETGSPIVVSGTVTETAPAATTIATAQITCSATEVIIYPADATGLGGTLGNFSGIDIYIGPTGVTAANGYTLKPNCSYNIDFPNFTGAIYGLAASGNPVVQRIKLS